MFGISPCPLDFSASCIKVLSKLEPKEFITTNNHTISDQMKRMVVIRLTLDLAHYPLCRDQNFAPAAMAPSPPLGR